MNKKGFLIQTLGIILFYIFGWLLILGMKFKETFENSRIFKDIIKEYKGATKTYSEFYKNDFDADKVNEARKEDFLKDYENRN